MTLVVGSGWDEPLHPYDRIGVGCLRARGSYKWTAHGPDVLAAWVAEMDFPPAPAVDRAVRAAVDRGFYGYPPEDADTGLPEAAAAYLAGHGLSVPAGRVRLLPDILRGIELAIDLYSPAGSPVVVPTPAYPPFLEVARVCGRPVVEVPLRGADTGWSYDLPAIDAALAAGAGTVIVCNPHNPLGALFDAAHLSALAELVDAHGARVIADEVHAPLVYDGSHTPYAGLSPAAAGHSVTLTSASKGWNLPGLKCAQIVLTADADVPAWDGLSVLRTHGASTLGICATIAAYTDGADWLADTLSYLEGNRRLLTGVLAERLPQIRFRPPAATYLAWLDCRQLGLSDPAAFFLDRARVAVNDGSTFGAAGRQAVRLNFATPRPVLHEILHRMADAVAEA